MNLKKRLLPLILVICLCFSLVTGCGSKEPEETEATVYSISVDQNIKNGTVTADKTSAKAGETVTVAARADANYQLVSITVNGEAISGSSFVMPEKNVVISATFGIAADLVQTIPANTFKITAQSAGGASATAHMTLTFGDSGVAFEAFVEDASVVEKDGVAILFSQELPVTGGLLTDGKTIKIAVSATGVVSLYATDADGVLQSAKLNGVTTEFATWSQDGTTLDGYHVQIVVPYETLGVTAETAKGTITVCPVVYSAYGSLPAQGASLDGVDESAQNTFAVLTDDNTFRANKYNTGSAQLGSYGSVEAGEYWDLSKDYYKDDTENYPNREAVLTGHDNNDNNLVFYRVSSNQMYVKATLTVTGVSNTNDQWPKFGLMLFDGASKNGVFMYVDSYMDGATNNTADNIIGTAIGYNKAANNDWGSWVTAQDGVFNLKTKSIVMEMVYQDGWVHMYANGTFIKSIYYGSYNENLHFGIKSFGVDLKVTNYMVSDDAKADGWADKLITTPDAAGVDILFVGDSYMDFWTTRGMSNNLSYTGASYANMGVAGTKVAYWTERVSEVYAQYSPSKIAFHIGVNDIDDAGADPASVIASLKEMFEVYHAAFPDATIYWNSLIPNTMFASKYDDYKTVNAGIRAYAKENAWLVYIDQTTVFDLNGGARQDVFDDGLHLNIDIGYPLWAKTMLTAMGYKRVDGKTMGDTTGYAHTGLWTFTTDKSGKETAYSKGNVDTALWFKNVSGENVYVEAMVSIGSLNNSDAFPKFGLFLRSDTESRWGIIDAVGYPSQKNTVAALIYRGIGNDNGYNYQTSWLWDDTAVWAGATNCDFSSVKLAIAKIGDNVYFLVNDVVYATCKFSGNVSVGYECFNLETTISNVVTSTKVDYIEKKLGLTCEDAKIDGSATDAIWTDEVLGNTIAFGDKGDGRYFTVAATKGSDGVYFLVNTYTYENTRTDSAWYNNANVEFRFGTSDLQQYIYVDGVGFNAVRGSSGIAISAIKAHGSSNGIYHTTFEFFAPFSAFEGYGANSDEIALKVWGWVWDSEGWNNVMNVGTWPTLTVSTHGLRFERAIHVSGTNAGVSVSAPSSARVGDTVAVTVTVAESQTLKYIKIDGVEQTLTDGKLTFTMPDSDVNIEVELDGINVKSQVVNASGEDFEFATVECETVTAAVGDTVTFTVNEKNAAECRIASVTVNGQTVTGSDGTYTYTVQPTDTVVMIQVNMEYALSEQIDGTRTESFYGTPISFNVEDGRSVTVWARSDDYGVYLYAEVYTNGVVTDAADFWSNHNFEFMLNGAEHGGANAAGATYRLSHASYSYTLLTEGEHSGKYLHTVEIYVNRNWIPGFDASSVALNYAFKAPGEAARYEYMINNQYDRTDWWRTSHSSTIAEHCGIGTIALPDCLHITKSGLVHDCGAKHATIDGDLSEYSGKTSLTLGNDNAKFDFTGFVAEDGVYLAITIYQNNISSSVAEWHLNDNLEIKLLGDRAGFSIIDGLVCGCGPITDYALVRMDGENGYTYKTVIELYYAHDFSTAKQATFQVGVNGNGFGGWQSLIWDANIAYVTESGIAWGTQLGSDWWAAQNQVAKDFAAGEGLTIDGIANESLYQGLTGVTYENVNGATITITGKKLSTGILILTTVNHTKSADTIIQGGGGEWWNYLDFEFRMCGNYNTQFATSTLNNGTYTAYCASKALTTQNADGTYTTVFETFMPFTTEYGGMSYSGDVQVCVGAVVETGFTWVTGQPLENTALYVNEKGFFLK